MNGVRGVALTALTLQAALGCVGSDAASVSERETVVTLPDGGTSEAPPAPPPTGVGEIPQNGIYVSASLGRDDADGSMRKPLRTIATAITIARTKPGTPVNVCAEKYAEAVKLVDGVTLFGYFDCSNPEAWRRAEKRAVIAAPTSPAVLAEGITWPAHFDGFEINAPDLTEPPAPDTEAASSIGMLIRGTQNLSLSEVTIHAGKAQDGLAGAEPPAGNADTGGKANGEGAKAQEPCTDLDANCVLSTRTYGRTGGTSKCAVGDAGGAGGYGGDAPLSSNQGTLESISSDDAHGKALSSMTVQTAMGAPPTTNGTDTPGSAGRAGAPGALGEHGAWTFTKGDSLQGTVAPAELVSPDKAVAVAVAPLGGSRPKVVGAAHLQRAGISGLPVLVAEQEAVVASLGRGASVAVPVSDCSSSTAASRSRMPGSRARRVAVRGRELPGRSERPAASAVLESGLPAIRARKGLTARAAEMADAEAPRA